MFTLPHTLSLKRRNHYVPLLLSQFVLVLVLCVTTGSPLGRYIAVFLVRFLVWKSADRKQWSLESTFKAVPTLGGLHTIATTTLASNDSEIFAELKQGFPLTILGSFKT